MSTPSAPSIVRTIVPIAVGQLVAYLATIEVNVPDDVAAGLTVVLGFVATTVYYLAVRFIEQKFPKLGALLGWAETPGVYAKRHDGVIDHDPNLRAGPEH